MEIKQLHYFIETCRYHSFTEAAKNCIITPQGLHISISRLEEELGCKLFYRTSNGLILTPDGEYLLPKAEEILKINNEAISHFEHEASRESSVLALFVRGTVELLALPSISAFKEKHPEPDVQFRVEQDLDCMQSVLNGEADLAVCSGPVQYKELSSKLLFSKRNVLVIYRSHSLALRKSVCIEDLKDLDLALPREKVSIRNTVLSLCRRHGFEPEYIENDEPRTAFNCAEIGLQAGIVNEVSAGKLLKGSPNVAIVPFSENEMRWDVYLIKRKNSPQTDQAKAFETDLLNTARAINAGGPMKW